MFGRGRGIGLVMSQLEKFPRMDFLRVNGEECAGG
jgi:hypothetical protein